MYHAVGPSCGNGEGEAVTATVHSNCSWCAVFFFSRNRTEKMTCFFYKERTCQNLVNQKKKSKPIRLCTTAGAREKNRFFF